MNNPVARLKLLSVDPKKLHHFGHFSFRLLRSVIQERSAGQSRATFEKNNDRGANQKVSESRIKKSGSYTNQEVTINKKRQRYTPES
jgi:hypothetical protein